MLFRLMPFIQGSITNIGTCLHAEGYAVRRLYRHFALSLFLHKIENPKPNPATARFHRVVNRIKTR